MGTIYLLQRDRHDRLLGRDSQPIGLLPCGRWGKTKFNPIRGIGLLGGRDIKIGKRHLAGCVLIEDPESLTGNGIVLGGNPMSVTEDKDGRQSRVFGRKRSMRIYRRPGCSVLAVCFVAKIIHLIRKPLYFGCQLCGIAIVSVYYNRLRRGSRWIIISVKGIIRPDEWRAKSKRAVKEKWRAAGKSEASVHKPKRTVVVKPAEPIRPAVKPAVKKEPVVV